MNQLPFFGVSNWPGARAGVSVVEVEPGRLALSVHLDPINWLLNVPPFPGGERFMVRFLLQLAQSAGEMADQLTTQLAADENGRHAASEPVESEWFDGGDQPLGGGQ